MTTEELKQEAEDWLRKFLLCNDCKRKCHCIELNAYCEEQVLKAYTDSAEPREKRIAELETRCNELFLQTCEQAEKIKELKEKLNFSTQYYKGEKAQDQLTKAKDHIKKLLGCLQQDTNDPQTNYYVVQYMTEAEQFLKEVENEKHQRKEM